MKKFAEEIRLILAIALGFPAVGTIATSPLWWAETDGTVVFKVYMMVCLALFALCLAISLRDEMETRDGKK